MCAFTIFNVNKFVFLFHLLSQLGGLGLAGFHLGLVYHVVCGKEKDRGKEKTKRGEKKVVDKIRVSDNAPANIGP